MRWQGRRQSTNINDVRGSGGGFGGGMGGLGRGGPSSSVAPGAAASA